MFTGSYAFHQMKKILTVRIKSQSFLKPTDLRICRINPTALSISPPWEHGFTVTFNPTGLTVFTNPPTVTQKGAKVQITRCCFGPPPVKEPEKAPQSLPHLLPPPLKVFFDNQNSIIMVPFYQIPIHWL